MKNKTKKMRQELSISLDAFALCYSTNKPTKERRKMKLLKPHSSWIHRRLYEKYIKTGRKPLVKVFENKEQALICRRSLFEIKYRRKENFFISIRGTAIFIADNKDDFIYESIY